MITFGGFYITRSVTNFEKRKFMIFHQWINCSSWLGNPVSSTSTSSCVKRSQESIQFSASLPPGGKKNVSLIPWRSRKTPVDKDACNNHPTVLPSTKCCPPYSGYEVEFEPDPFPKSANLLGGNHWITVDHPAQLDFLGIRAEDPKISFFSTNLFPFLRGPCWFHSSTNIMSRFHPI